MRYALAIGLMFALTGCATTTATGEINRAACDVWRPISWSAQDTDQTIREIKVGNARQAAWCKR